MTLVSSNLSVDAEAAARLHLPMLATPTAAAARGVAPPANAPSTVTAASGMARKATTPAGCRTVSNKNPAHGQEQYRAQARQRVLRQLGQRGRSQIPDDGPQ